MEKLTMNLPAHFNEILVDIQEAKTDYKKQDYFEFGENLGEVLVLAVGQSPMPSFTQE